MKEKKQKMDNYIVMTYYQLMVAIAFTLKSKRKSRLFVLTDYLSMNPELESAIKDVELFEEVRFFSERLHVNDFYTQVKSLSEPHPRKISKLLYTIFDPLYSDVFQNCQKSEKLYLFNELQHYYYYLERLFNRIIKVEDGYDSFAQELKIHKLTGERAKLYKIVGKGFPVIKSKSEKISKIIISRDNEEIPDEYRPLIEIIDTQELFQDRDLGFGEVILKIFKLDQCVFKDSSIIILTQPLARASYCNRKEQYLIYQLQCEKYYKDYNIYIKPHPADKLNYNLLSKYGAEILPKDFPIELLNFKDVEFDLGVTFGSTSMEIAKYIKDKVVLFEHDENFTRSDVKKYIKKYLKPYKNKVSYLVCIDSHTDVKTIKKTLARLLKMTGTYTIICVKEEGTYSFLSNETIFQNLRVIDCPLSTSLIEKRRIAFENIESNYVMFIDPGFYVSSSLNKLILEQIKKSSRESYFDLISVDMTHKYKKETFLRQTFKHVPPYLAPYFLQNRVIHKTTLELASFSEVGSFSDLKLYVEILANTLYSSPLTTSVVRYRIDKPQIKKSHINYDFSEQLDIYNYFSQLYQNEQDEIKANKYLMWLAGFVFSFMAHENEGESINYDNFMKSEAVIPLKLKAFDLLVDMSNFKKQHGAIILSKILEK